jgi:hypothetical protein
MCVRGLVPQFAVELQNDANCLSGNTPHGRSGRTRSSQCSHATRAVVSSAHLQQGVALRATGRTARSLRKDAGVARDLRARVRDGIRTWRLSMSMTNVFCKSGCKSSQTLPRESSPSVAGGSSVEYTLDENIHTANNELLHHSFVHTLLAVALCAPHLSLSLSLSLSLYTNAQTPAIAPSHYGRYIPLPGNCDGTGVVGPEP